eukprot:Plantae.Rhodophyta-Palmaria_palmata.ctg3449.p1 GENE.Plantae.Rhodophyta-Palmaria_palmata.ctg3449~~Plantae.Rhodophyta-Palmaria_palmata.ctg3449.p1  ORF type:complete len:277 (+),score=18.94 Plantae.Rhodophyta-Palmaria_palmata.ctg3449:131-961(+)
MKVMRWMQGKIGAGDTKIPAAAMKRFPDFFQYADETQRQSVCKRSRRWFNTAKKTLEDAPSLSAADESDKTIPLTITRRVRGIRKSHRTKSAKGRGRKRKPCTIALHDDLHDYFNHARRTGGKLNGSVLVEMALELTRDAPADSPYHASTIDKPSGNLIHTHITTSWMTRFCTRYDVISRAQTGKLLCGPEKEKEKELSVIDGINVRDLNSHGRGVSKPTVWITPHQDMQRAPRLGWSEDTGVPRMTSRGLESPLSASVLLARKGVAVLGRGDRTN